MIREEVRKRRAGSTGCGEVPPPPPAVVEVAAVAVEAMTGSLV